MTAIVLGLLAALAIVDGACSGFRSALGRTGLIDHQADDLRATYRGVVIVALLLAPATIVFALDVASGTPVERYADAGIAMLGVLVPYALIVGLALAAYGLLGWRQKYLAMAVILGPFTLIRPVVAIGSGVAGVLVSTSGAMVTAILLAVLAALLVEPVADRRWARGAALSW